MKSPIFLPQIKLAYFHHTLLQEITLNLSDNLVEIKLIQTILFSIHHHRPIVVS